MPAPQANPAPHPIDYIALLCLLVGAASSSGIVDLLPSRYAGFLYLFSGLCVTYTKWLGSQQDRNALTEGQALGADLKLDIEVASAKPATPITPVK